MAFPSAGPVDVSVIKRVAKDDLGLNVQPKAGTGTSQRVGQNWGPCDRPSSTNNVGPR